MIQSAYKLLFLLIFVAMPAFAMPTLPDDDDDFELAPLGCDEFLAAMGSHGSLFSVLLTSNRRAVEDFWLSRPMRSFLETFAPTLLDADPWDNAQKMVQYLDERVAEYAARKKMNELRTKSLRQALAAHGAHEAGKTGIETLQAVSRRNKEALLGGRTYTTGQKGMERAEAIVQKLNPVFTHNAPREVQVPKSPLLSSRQLVRLGFDGGLNTASFNQWLQADDQVFFFVHIARVTKTTTRAYSQRNMSLAYGNSEAVVVPDYAAPNGWISAYVMDPDDLLEFGDKRLPRETTELRTYLSKRYRVTKTRTRLVDEIVDTEPGGTHARIWDIFAKDAKTIAGFTTLRESLHQLDFTPGDFTHLLRTQVLNELKTIRDEQGEPAYQRLVVALEEGDRDQLAQALKILFYDPLNMPRDFEMKIPVGVMPEGLTPGTGR